ncbi:MAG: AAA family ATPase [Bacteroidales bacterium]|jgi:exodeoxyribonuclease-5|nr:AAA family ATPase [Bacteroidales bacterium]
MLKNHIIEMFLRYLKLEPVEGQKRVMESLAEMMVNPGHRSVMLIKGYAGTGKTSVISAFIHTLSHFGIPSVLMAPTGRAAKVLSTYSGRQAFTIHKKIYRQQSANDAWGRFTLNFNACSHTFFIVDEASMISRYSADRSYFGSGCLLDDLISFVFSGRNCSLILIGDTAQLPPVGQDESPALDAGQLEAYGLTVRQHELTEVMRQSQESGILYNATIVRQQLETFKTTCPTLQLRNFTDIVRIAGNELIETISDAYDHYGMEETMIVCRSNKQANRYNQGIRNRILYREEELTPGDLLMAVRNNYYWIQDESEISFIANGDIAEVRSIRKYTERYGFRFAEVELSLPDYHDREFSAVLLLDTLSNENASLGEEQHRQLYDAVASDYEHISPQKERIKRIKTDPFFNALQVKFAYAVTCHKAQGGQWKCIFLDQGWFNDSGTTPEYLRWLYTALTRSTEKLYLVNFPEQFFTGSSQSIDDRLSP